MLGAACHPEFFRHDNVEVHLQTLQRCSNHKLFKRWRTHTFILRTYISRADDRHTSFISSIPPSDYTTAIFRNHISTNYIIPDNRIRSPKVLSLIGPRLMTFMLLRNERNGLIFLWPWCSICWVGRVRLGILIIRGLWIPFIRLSLCFETMTDCRVRRVRRRLIRQNRVNRVLRKEVEWQVGNGIVRTSLRMMVHTILVISNSSSFV